MDSLDDTNGGEFTETDETLVRHILANPLYHHGISENQIRCGRMPYSIELYEQGIGREDVRDFAEVNAPTLWDGGADYVKSFLFDAAGRMRRYDHPLPVARELALN